MTDDAGNKKTEFTPFDEVDDVSLKPRSPLEKRREACGPGSVNTNEADEANKCLIDGFGDDKVNLYKNSWVYVRHSSLPSLSKPSCSISYLFFNFSG